MQAKVEALSNPQKNGRRGLVWFGKARQKASHDDDPAGGGEGGGGGRGGQKASHHHHHHRWLMTILDVTPPPLGKIDCSNPGKMDVLQVYVCEGLLVVGWLE